jgi:hypothetical protein
MLMTTLVGAAALIIIATVVFLFALGVLRRQVGQEPEVTGTPVREEIPALPSQEFFADHPGTADSLISDNEQGSNVSGLGSLNRESQWGRGIHQSGPYQDNFMSQSMTAFATEPVQTEPMPQVSTPNTLLLPSTPMPQQQAVPSTPVDMLEMPAREVVTDPILEAMMQQVQAGLYVIPEREDTQQT